MTAQTPELVAFLVWTVAWHGGRLPVFLGGGERPATFVSGESAVEVGAELHRRAVRWDFERSLQVEIGAPHGEEMAALWCPLDTLRSARCAAAFRPLPSLVLKLGSGARRVAIWTLNEPIPSFMAEDANRRLAYKLRAPYRLAVPSAFRVPVPGTFLRVGRRRPASVTVTRMEVGGFARSQVVGTLKDPPKSYVQRMRESGAWR